ncbi:MAG: MiaB/RimO family radical SAM methylthiotransferase, partial [Desulfovibrio sp.]|nr:MiaB/RimO family radical SAM methylthiotransferase [Desulfovibrio sp.]
LGRLRRRPLLAVAGCMVGRYGAAELARELPEVDLWLPTEELARWPALVDAALGLAAAESSAPGRRAAHPATAPAPCPGGRLLSTGPSYAWLKVGEGCRHRCAFCTIPSIRGPLRSTPAQALLAEARGLLAQGVRELDLVAQDVSSWGHDLAGAGASSRLEDLITALAGLEGLAWLRLLYLYPTGVTEGLLARMAELGPPVLPYFDIPFQHAAPGLLRAMGRPFAGDPRRVVERVRAHFPEAALRTTFIVGYPGETEAQFAELCRFVEETRFTHVGVFAYQAEEGTPAAALPEQVPVPVREERRARLMELQAAISADILAATVGSRLPVLVDAPTDEWPGLHKGRVWFQAPEVDGVT